MKNAVKEMSNEELIINGTFKNDYNYLVSLFQEGSTVGLMRTAEGQLHVYLDGRLKAKCKLNIPSNVYAVVDLFGKGCQATITGKSDVVLFKAKVLDT